MKINEYIINTNKIINNKNIVLISNTHISDNSNFNILYNLINNLYIINPDIILIAGNLYDADCNDIMITQKETIEFLKTLSRICKTYISYGNHELKPLINRPINLLEIYNKKAASSALLLMSAIQKLETNQKKYHLDNPIHFIGQFTNNTTLNDKDISITGINFDYHFYYNKNGKYFTQDYANYLIEEANKITDKTFNILICHNPIILNIFNDISILNKYDLILSSNNINTPTYNKIVYNKDKANIIHNHGLTIINNTNFIISNGITKHNTKERYFQRYDKNNNSNIELIKIRKK